jgi:hypothetical protein
MCTRLFVIFYVVFLFQILVCIGVGADRANGVSDAATLRAVAELAAASAFYGCVSLDTNTGELYRKCIEVCERLLIDYSRRDAPIHRLPFTCSSLLQLLKLEFHS